MTESVRTQIEREVAQEKDVTEEDARVRFEAEVTRRVYERFARVGERQRGWPVQDKGEHADDYNVRMEEAMFGQQD
jgi:hypothetical protein